jgi:phosphoserine phosphatase
MLLSDVTGHGIGSALSAVQVRAMLRMAVRIGADLPTIARHLNDQLTADLFGGRFITAWLGELDAHQHTLTYFSAGQAPLIHYRAASNEFDILDAEAPPFGIIESMPIKSARPLTLRPGDIFAVFSDGVFESPGPDGERFGQQRILRIIEENRRESGGTILLELRKALADFGAGTQPTDDQTAVIIKRT